MNGRLLDLTTPAPTPAGAVADDRADTSKFLGVHFACCDAYSRSPARARSRCSRLAKMLNRLMYTPVVAIT